MDEDKLIHNTHKQLKNHYDKLVNAIVNVVKKIDVVILHGLCNC